VLRPLEGTGKRKKKGRDKSKMFPEMRGYRVQSRDVRISHLGTGGATSSSRGDRKDAHRSHSCTFQKGERPVKGSLPAGGGEEGQYPLRRGSKHHLLYSLTRAMRGQGGNEKKLEPILLRYIKSGERGLALIKRGKRPWRSFSQLWTEEPSCFRR